MLLESSLIGLPLKDAEIRGKKLGIRSIRVLEEDGERYRFAAEAERQDRINVGVIEGHIVRLYGRG
jgi:hypothetical protein